VPTVKATDDAQRWQTFSVVGGVIARSQADEFEGLLKLADNLALTFFFGPKAAHWTWLPEEPKFTPNQAGNEEGADRSTNVGSICYQKQ
jgi:hypothetical protein